MRLALGAAGALIGSFFGAPGLGFTAGSIAGALLFPASPTEGPRLRDLNLRSGMYGNVVPIHFGTTAGVGQVGWGTPILTETADAPAKKDVKKGKVPNQISFRYTANFAVFFGEGGLGPAERLLELKINDKLVVDTRSGALITEREVAGSWRVYLGDQTAPDPLIAADLGPQAPCWPGERYIVFEGLDVTEYGGTLPTIWAAWVDRASASDTFGSVAMPTGAYAFWSRVPFLPYLVHYYGSIILTDIRRKAVVMVSNAPTAQFFAPAVDAQLNIYGIPDQFTHADLPIVKVDIHSGAIIATSNVFNSATGQYETVDAAFALDATRIFVAYFGSPPIQTVVSMDGAHEARIWILKCTTLELISQDYIGHYGPIHPPGLPRWGCSDWHGAIWVACAGKTLIRITDPWSFEVFPLDFEVGYLAYHADDHSLIMGATSDGITLAKFDIATESVIATTDYPLLHNGQSWQSGIQGNKIFLRVAGGTEFTFNFAAFDVVTLQCETLYSGAGLNLHWGFIFDRDTQTAWEMVYGQTHYDWKQYGRTNFDVITVGDIVAALSARCGKTPADYDVAALSQPVTGMVLDEIRTGREWIEMLAQLFGFDTTTADTVTFAPRGAEPVTTIAESDLGAASGGSDYPERLDITIPTVADLPSQVDLSYVDIDLDFHVATQAARRSSEAATGARPQQVRVPVIMTANVAAQCADRMLWLAWASRTTAKASVLPRHAWLAANDVVLIEYRGAQYRARIMRMTWRADFVVEVEAAIDDPTAHLSDRTGVVPPGYRSPAIPAPAFTLLAVLDAALARDSDDLGLSVPAIYAASGGLGTDDWRGAAVYRARPNEDVRPVTTMVAPAAMFWLETVVPPWAGTWWDDTTVLVLRRICGAEPVGVSDDQLLNGANLLAVGAGRAWEYLQFGRVVELGEDRWQVSHLLRGRRGTEVYCDRHAAGERAILMTDAVHEAGLALGDLGQDWTFSAISADLLPGLTVALTPRGESLMPYAPCQVAGSRAGGGDWTIAWLRQTRLGGDWRDYVDDVPLAEETERYDLEILDSRDGAVVRSFAGLTTPAATYAAAEQTADFGAVRDFLFVRVCQLSTAVGRGRPATPFLAALPRYDVDFERVVMLCPFDGSDGSTTVLDRSPAPKAIAAVGAGIALQTADKVFGTASLLGTGTGTAYLAVAPLGADFDIDEATDYTIEFRLKATGPQDGRSALSGAPYGGQRTFAVMRSGGAFGLHVAGTRVVTIGDGALDGTWHHLALCRAGATTRAFRDGALIDSSTASYRLSGAGPWHVLGDPNAAALPLAAAIDELRVTKGVARYTAAFVPPAMAHPES